MAKMLCCVAIICSAHSAIFLVLPLIPFAYYRDLSPFLQFITISDAKPVGLDNYVAVFFIQFTTLFGIPHCLP